MSGGSLPPHGGRRSTTRALLQVAAFAALQVIVIVVLTPVLGRLAAWFPPAYALVACTQTFLLFSARRFTGLAWGATLAAGITALVCAPFTPLGWLLAVPLMTAGVLFDLVLRAAQRRRWTERRDSLVSGVVVGAALFAVSLPVMSPEHLGPVILGLTLLARMVATAAGALLSARLVRQLERVGVSRAVSPR